MIAALSGKILDKLGDRLVLDVNGVGYELTVTGKALGKLGAVGSSASLVVYTDVRETAISLFGFADAAERELFLLLKKVKGVGSKLAVTVVSFLDSEVLLSSIGTGDVAALQKVPGVGKKTAERLIVELREHVGNIASEVGTISSNIEVISAGSAQSGSSNTEPGVVGDVLLALEKLGFSAERAKGVVKATLDEKSASDPSVLKDAGALLRYSLANL